MKELVIGFLGCGNVGCGVWKLLKDFEQELNGRNGLRIRVKRILVRDVNKQRGASLPRELLTTSPDDVLTDPEISLVVEYLGGEQPAADYMLKALAHKKTVVTANKVAVALNWEALQSTAQANGVGLYYEASVCGAIPIIHTLTHSLQGNRIGKLMGIINGTTNYILSRMSEQGEAYDGVLKDAQRLGLAEPDPATDVEGLDAAYKLSIMASLAFNTRVPFSAVYCEGITHITPTDIACGKELGYVLKLLGIAKHENATIEARVHPTFVPKEHPIASVSGAYNAVYVTGSACREMMLQGRGAGDMPTASAILSDILKAASAEKHYHPPFSKAVPDEKRPIFSDNWESAYFIRLAAIDAPGVLAKVAGCFANENVSIASMLQKETVTDGRVPLIFITHKAHERSMHAALKALDESVARVESLIRVEG